MLQCVHNIVELIKKKKKKQPGIKGEDEKPSYCCVPFFFFLGEKYKHRDPTNKS